MKLEYLDGIAIGELVNSGELSPVDVIKYFKNRIESRNSAINAFTYCKFDEALEEAKLQERRLRDGEYLGPFAGVPVGLKDFLPSKTGWTNSHGGVRSLIQVDEYDSEFYKAARALGAIAVGKTNAPAFGFSGACQNEMYGQTKNPFDLSRTSGGSSGGTASAVADGLIVFGEGGDAGGSIRIPSGWCNLFGFKPSIGTVPSYCRPDGWAATHPYCFNGSITKSVRDSATMLTQMAQYNPRDPMSLPINSNKDFVELMKKSMKGKKVAFTYDFNLYPQVDYEIKDVIFNACSKLESAGLTIDCVEFEWTHTLRGIMYCWAWAISVDTDLDLENWKHSGLDLIKDHPSELTPEFIHYNEIASKASIRDMRTFNEIRTEILDNFENIFEQYDFIISPTATCQPLLNEWNGKCLEINGKLQDEVVSFISFGQTPMVNFIGYPAASIPAGLTSTLLPVGMQVIGKQYCDEDVIALSKTLEDINPWKQNYSLAFNR